jgi:hypothetical protein
MLNNKQWINEASDMKLVYLYSSSKISISVFFHVLLAVHLSIILVINQPNAQILVLK